MCWEAFHKEWGTCSSPPDVVGCCVATILAPGKHFTIFLKSFFCSFISMWYLPLQKQLASKGFGGSGGNMMLIVAGVIINAVTQIL